MGIVRFFFYPLIRAGEQLRDSKRGIGEAVAAVKKTTKRLSVRGEVVDPAARFEELVVENEWTNEELVQQLVAVRRTKFFAMASTVSSFLLVLYFLVGVPMWVAFFVVPIALFVIALGIVMTLKYTLYQEQLRRRKLVTVGEIFSEPTFFKAVFK